VTRKDNASALAYGTTAAQRQAWVQWRLEQNKADLDALRRHLAAINDDCFGRPPCDLRVEPGLVRPGECVKACLRTAADAPSGGEVQVQANYLGAKPGGVECFTPEWRRAADGWEAEVVFTPAQLGNWRVVWEVGGYRLSRVLGVVEPGQVVVTLWVGSNTPLLDAEIHQYDLPGDTWVTSSFGSDPVAVLDRMRPFAQNAHRYGDRLAPFVNADFLLPGIPNSNLFLLDQSVQREGIRQVQELWRLLGLPPIEILASYTPGHRTIAMLKELRIPVLNSLCVWQNTRDGTTDNAWLINHLGAPNSPYYVAEDDFRKVAPGRSGVVAFSMGSTSNVRMYDFISYDGCVTNCMPSQRYACHGVTGGDKNNNAIEINADRFFTIVDGWLHDAANNAEPVFVTAALENFHQSEFWQRANAQAVDYLVRRAREGRVVFASAADVAGFYHRHYPVQPQQVYFQHDGYCGMRHELKPDCLPDRIEMSNARFHALFTEGRQLPQLLWDYTVPWENPEWVDSLPIRNEYGTVAPEAIDAAENPAGTVPVQADLRGVRAKAAVLPDAQGATISVRVDTPRPLASLPLAVWHLPMADATLAEAPACAKWQPVRDGWTDNVHGVLVLSEVPAGGTSLEVRLKGKRRKPRSMQFAIENAIGGRTFLTSEGPRTYLWRKDGIGPLTLIAEAPPDVAVRYNDGTAAVRDAAGRLAIVFEDTWSRESPCLTGGTPEQVGGKVRFGALLYRSVTPFVGTWRLSRLCPPAGNLEGLPYPVNHDALGFEPAQLSTPFANVTARFREAPGDSLLYFACRMRCTEAMSLSLLLGYDGPVKLWVDGQESYHDPNGTNPAAADAVSLPFAASAGEHEVLIALGSNGGKAWGIFFRVERMDVDESQRAAGLAACRLPEIL